MQNRATDSRRALMRAGMSVVAGFSAAVFVLPVAGAQAAPSPSPTPSSSASSTPSTSTPLDAAVSSAEAAAAAKAAQIQAVQAEYAVATAKLDSVQTAAEVAAEKYNGAQALLQQRTTEATAAGTRADVAVQAAKDAQGAIGDLAAHTYMGGGDLGDLEPFLTTGGPQAVLDRAAMLGTLSAIRNQGLQRAQAASAVASVLQRQASIAQAQQLAAAQAAKTARDTAQTAVDAATAEAASIKTRQDTMIVELATLQQTSIAMQESQQAAAQAAGILRNQSAALKTYGALGPGKNDSPPTKAAAKAIAYATAQLGKWYQWAAAGPDRFDCSGLTMMAWKAGGVSLGHYTGFQYDSTKHVSIADRRPGDLIFFGPTVAGIHHVGLYIGNDTMIEAPHTGAQVRYGNIWRSDLILTVGRP